MMKSTKMKRAMKMLPRTEVRPVSSRSRYGFRSFDEFLRVLHRVELQNPPKLSVQVTNGDEDASS